MYIVLLLLLLLPDFVECQDIDNQIYGKFNFYNYPVNSREVDAINSGCFRGFSYLGCKPTNIISDQVITNSLPYYVGLLENVEDYYCLQCCGINQVIDYWELECPLDVVTALQYNIYGYVLYLSRNRFDTDTSYITCPLKRSGCEYDENDVTLNCDGKLADTTYLHGYKLTG